MYTAKHLCGCTPRQFYELASSSSDEEGSYRVSHTTVQYHNNHRTAHEEQQLQREQEEEEEENVIESLQAQLQRCETMLHRLSAQQLRYDVAVEARLELMQRTLDEALQTRTAYLQECVQQLRRRCAEAWQQQRDALDELSCELAASTRVQLCRQQQTQEEKREEEHRTTTTTITPATTEAVRECASELCSLAPPALQAVHVTCAAPSSCTSVSRRSRPSASSSQRSCSSLLYTQSACEGDDFITPSPPYATRAAASLSSSQRKHYSDGRQPYTQIQTPYTIVPTCTIEECDMSADHEASVVRTLTQDASFDVSPEHRKSKHISGIEQGSAYFASQAAQVHPTPRAALRERTQPHRRTWQRQRDESLAEAYIAGQP